MSLYEQLKQLFPEHTPAEEPQKEAPKEAFFLQSAPLLCKFEKRNGKPQTLIEGYNGADSDFKKLTQLLKTSLSVGGSYKNEVIIIQGNYRDRIMEILKQKGFNVKRVGG